MRNTDIASLYHEQEVCSESNRATRATYSFLVQKAGVLVKDTCYFPFVAGFQLSASKHEKDHLYSMAAGTKSGTLLYSPAGSALITTFFPSGDQHGLLHVRS